MTTPHVKLKKKKVLSNIAKVLLLVNLFLSSCSDHLGKEALSENQQFSASEKKWMEKFFTDYFMDEPTIYTLFGTKPISSIEICFAPKSEWIKAYEITLQNLPSKEKDKQLKKFTKYCQEYDLNRNWEKWIELKQHLSISSFLFVLRPTDFNEIFSGYIANVREVFWVLHQHYDEFERVLGQGFDPLAVVFDFENPHSVFWDKIFQDHYLSGILFGFGERNAFFFSEQLRLEKERGVSLDNSSLFLSNHMLQKQRDSLKKFPIPAFRSYEEAGQQDPIVLKFLDERQTIIKRFKHNNFQEIVLALRTGSIDKIFKDW